MRELKFRAWNDEKYVYAPNRFVYTDDYDKNDVDCYEDIGAFFATRDNIEQYTGLKDKNGKEICEGDIVKFDCGDQTPAEIVYEAGSYFLRATDDGSLFYDPDTDKPCPMGWFGTWGLEVIGNIHENGNLLK